ncbi:hypothetical protein AYO38_09140 [bacterium SCGC AG-212-C10]|nr:hypothetical protein AYO38_09140 [bacterium SCGC AG-212-C10]
MPSYNKLVRDLIPELLAQEGTLFTSHVAGVDEFSERLFEKLVEEARELQQSRTIEELADVLDVLAEIILLTGFSEQDIARARTNKTAARGAFSKRIILDRTEP